MKFTISRENLLGPLQLACGVVERRQTAPILSNLLLVLEDDRLVVTGTDQEVEITVSIAEVEVVVPGEVTVPARKLLEICKSLPEGADLRAELQENRVAVDSGRFSSHLATLPAADFPDVEPDQSDLSIMLQASDLTRLLQRTSFAMAQQDVRYFFNGILIETRAETIKFVATNGQRLATSTVSGESYGDHQFIVPRKAITELARIADGSSGQQIKLEFTSNHMQVSCENVTMITKLIDATYPDYTRAIPSGGDKVLVADRRLLREALSRTAILSNELYHNVRLMLKPGKLDMHANNPQQEEAEESLAVAYEGPELEIGFNVSYLIETLAVMRGEEVRLTFGDASSACLLEDLEESESLYVISPMVL